MIAPLQTKFVLRVRDIIYWLSTIGIALGLVGKFYRLRDLLKKGKLDGIIDWYELTHTNNNSE